MTNVNEVSLFDAGYEYLEENMNELEKQYRFKELVEKMHEFILNESVFADDNPSWGEVAEAESVAMQKWNETDEGKEMTALIMEGFKEDESLPPD